MLNVLNLIPLNDHLIDCFVAYMAGSFVLVICVNFLTSFAVSITAAVVGCVISDMKYQKLINEAKIV